MPALESILSRATGPDDRLLRGKAIECITLIGRVPASLSAGRSGDAIALIGMRPAELSVPTPGRRRRRCGHFP